MIAIVTTSVFPRSVSLLANLTSAGRDISVPNSLSLKVGGFTIDGVSGYARQDYDAMSTADAVISLHRKF